jgi:hypothetical protein
MLDDDGLPYIEPVFDCSKVSDTNILYREAARRTLKKILPANLFSDDLVNNEALNEQAEIFRSTLPLVAYSAFQNPPFELSFYLLSPYRSNAFKFFFEMVSRWLVPGKRLNVLVFYAVDFRIPDISSEIFTLSEVIVRVESEEELRIIKQNLPIIESEISLGVNSAFRAQKILEIRGLQPDEKTAMVQEHITHLVEKLPKHFDQDVFVEMQHVLVRCKDEFKQARKYRHLSRIISIQYLFRRDLREKVIKEPNKRHLSFKTLKAEVRIAARSKNVLGIIVGVNFIRENEVFEERHLIKAVQNYLPNVSSVQGSFFANAVGKEPICTLYLEVTKNDGSEFTSQEIRHLRRKLPGDLKDRIEHLMHPVFMPFNEEETMRNILTLSNQLKYLRDIPQVMIIFEKQTDSSLSFMVILLRILNSESLPVVDLFSKPYGNIRFFHDRTKMVGMIRKKYSKEANVFHLELPKNPYLRSDYSVDLQKARQDISNELSRVFEDFRDYNGGMISKQNELLCQVRDLLPPEKRNNEFLLENFFYSLAPAVMRSVCDPIGLKNLFLMLLEAIGDTALRRGNSLLKIREDQNFFYAILSSQDSRFREDVSEAVEILGIPSINLASAFVTVADTPFMGLLYKTDSLTNRIRFQTTLEEAFNSKPALTV